ncbi:MAG TPA: hypothetical protein VF677_09615 [Flavobacterium sp.]|jgi:hypothetical protein
MKKIKIINIFLIFILNIACNNSNNIFMKDHNVIEYNTDDFKKFEKHSTIKLKEAWNIQKKYALEKNENPKNWLFFIIDGNYVFTSIFEPKLPAASTGGIWVNSETGEIKEINSDIMLRYKEAYNGDGKEFLF